MRVFHLVIKLFLLSSLIIGISGCQKDPVQPMGAATHPAKASVKKKSEKKPTSSSAAKENTGSKKTKSVVKKATEQSKTTISKKLVAVKPQVTTKPKTTSTATSTKETTNPAPSTPVATVNVTVTGYNGERILYQTKVPYKKGETFLDATLYILKEKQIQFEVSGSGASAYVKGINNEYEFDHGAKSGWLCLKNGVRLTQSAGATSIKAGDKIEWYYTTTGE